MFSTPETSVHVLDKNREISPLERGEGYEGKDLEKRWVLRREWKTPWDLAKIHDLSAQHIFPSKRYTTYECIPERAATVPSARSTIVKKIKRFIIWLYKWSRVTFTELPSAVVKSPWHYHFPWLSMTFANFHDFPGLENGLPKFHDFPWPGGTLLVQKKSNRVSVVPPKCGMDNGLNF